MDFSQRLEKKIKINVGTDSYHVHEYLLHKDMNFCGTLRNGALEINESPEMFGTFVQWLYTRQFLKEPKLKVALELWIFGGKITCQKLQNFTMNFIRDYHYDLNQYMGVEDLRYVFAATKDDIEENHLKAFCVALLHHQNNQQSSVVADILLKVPDAIDPYLLHDSDCNYYRKRVFSDPRDRTEDNNCRFHNHSDDEDLYLVCDSEPYVL